LPALKDYVELMKKEVNVKFNIGPERDFIKAFIDLFEAFNDPRRQIVDLNRALRVQLYKLTYFSDSFNLY
jgi:hypothetical protein